MNEHERIAKQLLAITRYGQQTQNADARAAAAHWQKVIERELAKLRTRQLAKAA